MQYIMYAVQYECSKIGNVPDSLIPTVQGTGAYVMRNERDEK